MTHPQTGPFKAIIFDMDGLLVDSETVWHIVETEMIESRGHKYTDDVRQQIIGLRLDEFMIKLKRIYTLPETLDDLINELVERMRLLIPHKVKAQPGAAEIVAYVQQHDIPRAIASSSPMSIIDAILSAQGWSEVFPLRCSADDDAQGKPAPDVYLRTARELGYAPADCLALEDSPTGSRAAVAAGMTCYAVPDTSHSKHDALAQVTPHVFNDLHEVLAALKNGHKPGGVPFA